MSGVEIYQKDTGFLKIMSLKHETLWVSFFSSSTKCEN